MSLEALLVETEIPRRHGGVKRGSFAGRLFATLGYPRSGWGMIKLTPEQQEVFVRAEPAVFAPVKGGWGRRGATNVRLRAAKQGAVREALITAWRNRAPKRLAERVDPS